MLVSCNFRHQFIATTWTHWNVPCLAHILLRKNLIRGDAKSKCAWQEPQQESPLFLVITSLSLPFYPKDPSEDLNTQGNSNVTIAILTSSGRDLISPHQ